MKKKYPYVLLFLIFSFPFIVRAQTDTIQHLPEVVITGTKIGVNKNDLPLTISIVNRNEIERSSESALLPVLSKWVPGLFVTERGVTGFGVSNGSAGVINIRGVGGGNRVLMLLDGQPQWAGLFGHHLPDMYVASEAERVEVIRGPGSLIYGSNAMGGVVNVVSRSQKEDGFNNQARIMLGSYNTQKYMFSSGYKKGKFSNFLSLNYNQTDGHRDNSDFKMLNGYYKASYQLNEHWNTLADLTLAKFKSENPGSIEKPMIDGWVDALRGSASASVENKYEKTGGALKLFYNYGRHEVNDGWKNGNPRNYLFESKDKVGGFMVYQYFHLWEGNTVTTGFDYKNWGGKAWNQLNAGGDVELVDKSVNEEGIYALFQQNLFRTFTLDAGIRLEMNETYGNEWVPQIGLAWKPLKNTTFKTSYSKGFRSPNIRELYMFQSANPDLKPEYMNNFDLSVSQNLLDKKLKIELTGFMAKGKDLIQLATIDGVEKNVNSGDFQNKGFEIAVSYSPVHSLQLAANYSYLHLKNPILAAPKNLAYFDVNYLWKRFTFNVNTQVVDGLYTRISPDTKTENYTLLNAKISYRPLKFVTVFLKGENLTDQCYEINDGFPMPGVVVFGGLNVYF